MCFLHMAAGRLAPRPRPEPLPGRLSSPMRRCLCVCVRGEGEERRAEAEGLKPGTWQTVLRLQGTGKEAQAQKA